MVIISDICLSSHLLSIKFTVKDDENCCSFTDDGIMAEMTLSLNAKQMFGHANQSYFNEHAFYLLELFRSQLTLVSLAV